MTKSTTRKSTTKPTTVNLTVKIDLRQAEGRELPDVVAYAFDQNGEFLASAPIPKGEEGEVALKLPAKLDGETIRVLAGPPVMEDVDENVPQWMAVLARGGAEERGAPSAATLLRRGAFEKRFRLSSDLARLELDIFRPDWAKWLFCPCVVRGRLIKRITLPDGSVEEMGVCYACVEIYEVDKFPKLILRLPDKELFRLRNDLIATLKARTIEPPLEKLYPEPPRVKIPPPPPPPPARALETSCCDEVEVAPAGALRAERASGVVMPERLANAAVLEMASSGWDSGTMAQMAPILRAGTASQLRDAMIAQSGFLVQLTCVWEWLTHYYKMDLIKCVCTDEQGRFQTTIWYNCFGDKPDLYFKAWQCISCTPHVVYDPGVACHTFWNYQCGTEVVLEVTDPAARVCAPPPAVTPPPGITQWIMPYAVGGTRLDQIKPHWQDAGTHWQAVGSEFAKRGLTDYGGITDAPFGSTLGLRLGHSSAIPTTQLYHYHWLYQKEGETTWHEFASPVAGTVVRHYVAEDLGDPTKTPTFPAYTLGPKSVGGMHLYEFKPHNPPSMPGYNTYWPTDTWFADIYSGILRSHNLPGGIGSAAGRYKIKVEIYDSSGNKVAPGAGTFQFIVPTGVASDGVTIETRPANTNAAHGPVEIDDDGFVFYLHIDNRECTATIDAPMIGAASAGDVCGFLRYEAGDTVDIDFHAIHPDNYAYFDFYLKRAAKTLHEADNAEVSAIAVDAYTDDGTGTPVKTAEYTGDGSGNFGEDFSLSNLLGPCSEAAFAEILWVYAKATNGWDRLNGYDDHDERGFALAPKPTP